LGEGGEKPERPKQLEENRQLAKGGQLIIGSKGTVDDWQRLLQQPALHPRVLPQGACRGQQAAAEDMPRVPENNPHKEWIAAIRANNPTGAGSNFEYSVPFTEMVCLRHDGDSRGKKFTWDSAAMKTSLPEADALLYPTYRKGWTMAETSGPVA